MQDVKFPLLRRFESRWREIYNEIEFKTRCEGADEWSFSYIYVYFLVCGFLNLLHLLLSSPVYDLCFNVTTIYFLAYFWIHFSVVDDKLNLHAKKLKLLFINHYELRRIYYYGEMTRKRYVFANVKHLRSVLRQACVVFDAHNILSLRQHIVDSKFQCGR